MPLSFRKEAGRETGAKEQGLDAPGQRGVDLSRHPAKELEQMGYSVVFWACSAVYTVTKALYDLFSGLKENGNTDATAAGMMEFGKFNQFIGLDHYKELERKYKVDRDD